MICLAQSQKCDTGAEHKRYALVLGVGTYTGLPAASHAMDDSQAMSQALKGAGFAVTLLQNSAMPALYDKDETDFLKQVQPGDVVFVYYSGHIVQGADGEDDFILPSNFDPSVRVNSDNALSVGRVLDDLRDRMPGKIIVMIEGPHPVGQNSVEILGSRVPGLRIPDALEDAEILFSMSAEEHQMAGSPSDPGVSPFTRAVAKLLDKEGLSPLEVFDQAREEVMNESGRRQIPLLKNYLKSGFCFLEPVSPVSKVEPAPPVERVVERVVAAFQRNKIDHEEYVKIGNGNFLMGCVPGDTRCKPEESPRHEVKLTKDFWMGRNEVQVDSFYRYWTVNKKPKKAFPPEPTQDYHRWTIGVLPMANVTWQQASDYCAWAGGRLPTEAEWEYAARAGGSDEIYPLNSENSRDKANFRDKHGSDIYLGVAPVRQFDPNAFKLYDMSGNVWEWVADWFGGYADGPAVDPTGAPAPDKKRDHILRGGSFESDWQEHLRLSLRRIPQTQDGFKTGFRCVLADTPATLQHLDPP
jgi:formylglycine-generating enzyme required for sulfatase activity